MERIAYQNLIVAQYRSIVGSLNLLFTEMGQRSEIELWRLDGVGSCRDMNRETAEGELAGPVGDLLVELRDRRDSEVPGQPDELTQCPYHRVRCGCILGDLKSPICISHVDYPSSLEKHLQIKGYVLARDICGVLQVVLYQNQALLEDLFPAVEITLEELPFLFMNSVGEMTKYVMTKPILRQEERVFENWVVQNFLIR